MNYELLIGIDTGTKTGIARWSTVDKEFYSIETVGIIEALSDIRCLLPMSQLKLYIEDARLVKGNAYLAKSKGAAARIRGVGSVSRDAAIWQEFCEFYRIDYETVAPSKRTKMDAKTFEKLTGWTERTDSHGRDAAMIVFGRIQ